MTPAAARVLVIDDDATLRGAVRRILERAGYDVLEAGDGAAGLQLHQQQGADVVIVDIFMPERDGLELIRICEPHRPRRRSSPCPAAAAAARSTCSKTPRYSARRGRCGSR